MPRSKTHTQAAAGSRGLSRDAILQAAVDLMEAGGESAFSLRKLGQKLGCDPMAVLYYFKSKEGLERAMADRLTARLRPPGEGLGWRERLLDQARQYRALALEHPCTFTLMQRFLNTGTADFGPIEMVHRALGDAGIGERDMPKVCLGWYASIIGLGMAEIGGLIRPANTGELAEVQALAEPDYALTKRLAPLYASLQAGEVHAYMVECLLDGIQGRAHAAAQDGRRP